jgi:hypothetical protein
MCRHILGINLVYANRKKRPGIYQVYTTSLEKHIPTYICNIPGHGLYHRYIISCGFQMASFKVCIKFPTHWHPVTPTSRISLSQSMSPGSDPSPVISKLNFQVDSLSDCQCSSSFFFYLCIQYCFCLAIHKTPES